jgi:hypothetical protein
MSDLKKHFGKKQFHPNLLTNSSIVNLIFLSILILLALQNANDASAFTQFYVALPDIIDDLTGITISVEVSDYKNFPVVSWTHDGSIFVPDNKTVTVEPKYDQLHLDNNDFLLAIIDSIDPGTRLYICVDVPYPNEQYECQWDAVDKNQTGYAEFDFYFQSHKDLK